MDSRLKSKLFKCCHFSCRVSTSGRLKRPSPERENQSLNLQALHKWRYHSGSGLSSCRNAIYTVWVVLYENWILKVTLPEKSVWDWSFLNFFFSRERICVSLTSGNYHSSLSGMCARHQTGVWRVPSCPLLEEKLPKPWIKNTYRALPALKTDDLNMYYKNENLLWKICLFYTPNRYQM